MLIIAGILAVLLIAAYVVTPIVSWLMANPLAGLVLFAVVVLLVSAALIRELKT
jgi:hypothetical protein